MALTMAEFSGDVRESYVDAKTPFGWRRELAGWM